VSVARSARRIAAGAGLRRWRRRACSAAAVTGSWSWRRSSPARWIGEPEEAPLYADGLYGSGSQEPLTLVMLGDSSAAGLGADEPQETPGALLAAGLAEVAGRPVRLHTYARTGAQTQTWTARSPRSRRTRPTSRSSSSARTT
jgi:hypothetical protein